MTHDPNRALTWLLTAAMTVAAAAGYAAAISKAGASLPPDAPLTFGETLSRRTFTITLVTRGYDLDRLAEAVSRHETCGCTCGTGRSRNNCHGFMGRSGPITFASKEDSFAAFKALWLRRYGDALPDLRDATTYVCGSSWPTGEACPGGVPVSWLSSVTQIYGSL